MLHRGSLGCSAVLYINSLESQMSKIVDLKKPNSPDTDAIKSGQP